jgi:GDPmannose 4,6-dehydratase
MSRPGRTDFSNLEYLEIESLVKHVEGDMTSEKSLASLIEQIKPTEVYNLAAQSFVKLPLADVESMTQSNALGVLYLLKAIQHYSPSTKFFQASSRELFGTNTTNGKQDENTPFCPSNFYAIAKLYAYWTTIQFRNEYKIFAVNGILSNHESPIRGKKFVTRKVTDGVARIKAGLDDKIFMGDLEAKRDWGYAGDYVEGMWRMLQLEKPDDFVLATGQSHSIKDLLQLAFELGGITGWEDHIEIDPLFKRNGEYVYFEVNPEKAKKVLGWEPKVSFKELIQMMLNADLARYSVK